MDSERRRGLQKEINFHLRQSHALLRKSMTLSRVIQDALPQLVASLEALSQHAVELQNHYGTLFVVSFPTAEKQDERPPTSGQTATEASTARAPTSGSTPRSSSGAQQHLDQQPVPDSRDLTPRDARGVPITDGLHPPSFSEEVGVPTMHYLDYVKSSQPHLWEEMWSKPLSPHLQSLSPTPLNDGFDQKHYTKEELQAKVVTDLLTSGPDPRMSLTLNDLKSTARTLRQPVTQGTTPSSCPTPGDGAKPTS